MKAVSVRFKEKFSRVYASRAYNFKTNIEGLVEGDKVVVNTQYGLEIGSVIDYVEVGNTSSLAWVLSKVDSSVLDREVKIAELKAQAQARAIEVRELQSLHELARTDDTLAGMLAELKTLGA